MWTLKSDLILNLETHRAQGLKAPHHVIETKEALGDQVEVDDLSDIKIEPEDFSSSIFTSLTSTTSTWSSLASDSSSKMSSFSFMCVWRLWS